MILKIEDNLYLEHDGMQFIMREYNGKTTVDKNTGEEKPQYKTHGYFPKPEDALNKYVNLKVARSTAKTLGELVNEIQGLKEYIKAQFEVPEQW